MNSTPSNRFPTDFKLALDTNIPKLREQLTQLTQDIGLNYEQAQGERGAAPVLDLFGNILNYMDLMERELFDLKVVLATTVEHSTDIENDLSNQTQQMHSRSQLFEFIVNHSSDWVTLINRHNIIEAVNESQATVLGKNVTQLNGRSIDKIWGSQFVSLHMQASIDACFNGQEIKEILYCNTAKLADRWCEFSYTPFKNEANEITHSLCVVRDVSARRRAESLLRDHALYLDKVNDAIIVIGMDKKVYFWNKSAERLYGWKSENVTDKKKIDHIMAEEAISSILSHVLEMGEWTGEMTHTSKSHRAIAVLTNWTLVWPNETEWLIVITATDITEKKLLEQQFLRIQRMEGIGSVASGIAHDLNNVLSALFMSIRLLKPKCTDDKSVQILELLDNSAKRGVSLVRQILEFARGIDGDTLLVPIPNLLAEIHEFAKSTFPKSISIKSTFSADLWPVVGNPTQLHQVLLNLCVNARDAMATGGSILITAENVAIRDGRSPKTRTPVSNGNYVSVTVADTGKGIPKSLLNKIFDPFFTTKDSGKGTGLGLSTVQTIIKNHNGFIEVTSQPSSGTEFRIYLPTGAAVSRSGSDTEQLQLSSLSSLTSWPI
ncbi:PAS domain S-box protein [bacterium]|nr:PAS domain S-box protein [bacterium]